MLLMTSPTLPTTVANTKIPRRNMQPVKIYSCTGERKKKFVSRHERMWRVAGLTISALHKGLGGREFKRSQCPYAVFLRVKPYGISDCSGRRENTNEGGKEWSSCDRLASQLEV